MKQFKINSIQDLQLYRQFLKSALIVEEHKLQNHWRFAKENAISMTFQSSLNQIKNIKSGWGIALGLIQNIITDIRDNEVFKNGFSWNKLWNTFANAVLAFLGVGSSLDNES